MVALGRPLGSDKLPERLSNFLDFHELSVTELAALLQVARPTVYTWAQGLRAPARHKRYLLDARVTALEHLVRKAHPKPLLPRTGRRDRLKKISELIHGPLARVSAAHSAGQREPVRGDLRARKEAAKAGLGGKPGRPRGRPRGS